MRHASGHNYRYSSFIVDVAMGQIPRSTERISSFLWFVFTSSECGVVGLMRSVASVCLSVCNDSITFENLDLKSCFF